MNMKKGFTLAEVMVVLSIIGVLSAILTPIANQSRPDEDVMKFKKASATLGSVLRELSTSSSYYRDGNLRLLTSGSAAGADRLCQSMADIMTTKSVSCKTTNTNKARIDCNTCHTNGFDTVKETMDTYCNDVQSTVGAEIITTDGVNWFMANPSDLFVETMVDGFYRYYKVLCIDVDGVGKGRKPFGFGIRVDGKLLTGKRADVWMEKCKIQRGTKDDSAGLTAAEKTICNE